MTYTTNELIVAINLMIDAMEALEQAETTGIGIPEALRKAEMVLRTVPTIEQVFSEGVNEDCEGCED